MTEQKIQEKEGQKSGSGLLVPFFGATDVSDETYEEMAKQGVLYGHKKSRKNPRFSEYVFATRNGVEVLDLQKTVHGIAVIAHVLKKAKEEKKSFLLVATQPAAKEAMERLSQALDGCSYVTGKWIGGLMTNFAIISKRLEYFKKKRNDMRDGKFEKYTKKERLMIEREVEKMAQKFAGLEQYNKVPDVIFIVDGSIKGHRAVIREARIKKVLILGIIDNDDNPGEFNYFIPANDHAKASIDWVVNELITKIQEK